MTERQVEGIDRHSAVPRSASVARSYGGGNRPGCRRDRVVRWSFKVRDGCC